jgi:hypothetical protein
VDEEGALGQVARYVVLYLLCEVVAPLYRPPARHEHVHRDEAPLAGRAGADGVETGARPLVAREDLLDLGLILRRQRPVQQTLAGVAQQPHPGPDDVGGDDEGY